MRGRRREVKREGESREVKGKREREREREKNTTIIQK